MPAFGLLVFAAGSLARRSTAGVATMLPAPLGLGLARSRLVRAIGTLPLERVFLGSRVRLVRFAADRAGSRSQAAAAAAGTFKGFGPPPRNARKPKSEPRPAAPKPKPNPKLEAGPKAASDFTRDDYVWLCGEVWRHNRLYYDEAAPEISDEEFDRLLRTVGEVERLHAEWTLPDSPTQRVGERPAAGRRTLPHETPMLSLANTYSREEIGDWLARLRKALSLKDDPSLCIELKVDGVAASFTYERGELVRAVTRGDGAVGDDVTENARSIANLPKRLAGDAPERLEVRGEVYMPLASFERQNAARRAAGLPEWANPRNAAAGSLKLLDASLVAARDLHAVMYAVASESGRGRGPRPQGASHDAMAAWGLPVLPPEFTLKHCSSLQEIWQWAGRIESHRHGLPFLIDGIVLKANDPEQQRALGATAKHPRWAIAFKFPPAESRARVREIVLQVGRSGVLTPVAVFDPPVELAGSTVGRASLHNPHEVARLDVREGDEVLVAKGGDVIPKVLRVLPGPGGAARPPPWSPPAACPSCGGPVRFEPPSAGALPSLRCVSPESCEGHRLQRLAYATARDALDVRGLSEGLLRKLLDAGLVERLPDLFALDPAVLAGLDGLGPRSAANLAAALERARRACDLPRLLTALGIPRVGRRTAEALAAALHSRAPSRSPRAAARLLLELEPAAAAELARSVPGVGPLTAESVAGFLSSPANRADLRGLLDAGMPGEEIEPPKPAPEAAAAATVPLPLAGLDVLVTGRVPGMTRPEAQEHVRSLGGRPVLGSAVTKAVSLLVVGEEAGEAKLKRARELGTPAMPADRFAALRPGDPPPAAAPL